jgi:ornithine cyclodeaminase/alanine dehydrogenase-like protein (mu-crystallin family)
MARPAALHLDPDQLWTAFEGVDPVDLLVDELIGRTVDREAWARKHAERLTTWYDDAGVERVLCEVGNEGCYLPAADLRACRAAGLCALAARQMLAPTVVTATVLGTSRAAQLHLATIARHVPDISHIAVSPTPTGRTRLQPRVIDQVDLAGIGLSVTRDVAEAVFGANLLIVADPNPWPLDTDLLPKGTVIINTTGVDLPDDLVNHVDEIYVDDLGLLSACPERYLVKAHLAGPVHTRPRLGNGWYRRPHIEADLGQLLTGAHPGRGHLDDIVLFELLGATDLDPRIATQLHRSARERGLGTSRPAPALGYTGNGSNGAGDGD